MDVEALVEPVATDVVAFLQGMIQIPSENPPGNVRRVAEYVADTLEKWGLRAEG